MRRLPAGVDHVRLETLFHQVFLAVVGSLTLIAVPSSAGAAIDPPGFRPRSMGLHALTGARIIPRPGVVLTNATLVISNGIIASVSSDTSAATAAAAVPPGARVWDSTGLTVYAGFIDPYVPVAGEANPVAAPVSMPIDDNAGVDARTTADHGGRGATASDASTRGLFLGVGGDPRDPGSAGPGAPSREVTPERRIGTTYTPETKAVEALRDLGFTAAQFVPGKGIIRGQAALVALGDATPNASLLRPDTALCVAFVADSSFPPRDQYPDSLMGSVALVRQTFFDAEHHAANLAHFDQFPGSRPRPGFNTALDALEPARRGQTVMWVAGSVLMIDRAARVADELGITRRVFVATGQEWLRPDLVAASGGPFIVPIAFPALPKLPDEADWDSVQLDTLRAWDWAPENPSVLRRVGVDIGLTTHGLSDLKEFRKNLRQALDRGLTEDDALAALTIIPARICGVEQSLGTLEAGRIANLTVVEGSYFDPSSRVRTVWVDGVPFRTAPPDGTNTTRSAKEGGTLPRLARDPASERGPLASPPHLLINNATLWTCGPAGVVTNAQLLVSGGRIQMLGDFRVKLPEDTVVIDGTGLHVTPGIIDCHSHSMILGNVNEATLPSTAMVRIGDVVNSESPNIHLQLAGGVTTVNLLHGSANPIGGQNCVIKLRLGEGPEGLKFTNAPPGIKFALGENVKQANWGERFTTRFPQSRMGVPTFYVNRFEAARQYADERRRAARPGPVGTPAPVPVARDLELEALVEILEGSRLIHCHSYRQDEIVAFLRTMESFGIRVATLQHILEGYKVADEIARHGAGASAFSDWWAFKYEVLDAIPHAGSILHQRNVLVSFNSDSSDHARRLNLEAAKAVKYGGTPEVEALKFVTLNPARQLGIDRWTGSLEAGKDADIAIWSGHPLDTRSACLQTWIEGRKYFDRAREPDRVRALIEERDQLVAKGRKISKDGSASEASEKARERFFLRALEQARHLGVVECADCQFPNRL